MLLVQCHRAVVVSVSVNVGDKGVHIGYCYLEGARMALERLVDGPDVLESRGLERQVVSHKAVEMRAVGLLAEAISIGRQCSS